MIYLMCLLLMIVDGIIIGTIISLICEVLLGDSPFARLIRLILSFCCGVGYFILCMYIGWGEYEVGIAGGLFVFLFPVAMFIILKVIKYMYRGKQN